jgi:PAS domain S-box-containing protein
MSHTAQPEHFVQFYESDAFLADSVAAYIGGAIAAGHSAAIIATPEHRGAIIDVLTARGTDTSGAIARGQFVALDAAETLRKFMRDGSPDKGLFRETIGALIAKLTAGGRPLRAFGEMVALLAADGNRDAAIQLEDLWNELGREHTFGLLCAYRIDQFGGANDSEPFERICGQHMHVVPSESFNGVTGETGRSLMVSLLQQKAVMLGSEIERRESVERALAQRDEELSDFLESANEGLHKVGPDGTIVWANKAELDLFGYARDEYIGHHVSEFHVDKDVIADMLARLRRGGTLTGQASQMRCKDGSIKHVMINSSGYFKDGEFVNSRCFTRDVTAIRETEELQRRLLEQERKARVEAERVGHMKDEFLATLSHELRTPLNAIFGWTQVIRMAPLDVASVTKGIDVIDRNVRAQTQLIEDLLDMSRIVAGKLRLSLQQTDLVPALEAAIEAIRPLATAKQIHIRAVLDPLAGPVSADAARLQQIMWNLLANSVKFTPKGGSIEVMLERVNSSAEISISDSGQGIAPDFLPHVFEQFRQEDARIVRRHGGLGLGLSIVKQIVDLHGGEVRAKSAGEGKGATFIVALPIVAAMRRSGARDFTGVTGEFSADFASNVLKGVRVLVVDDDADARELVCHLLSGYEADVRTAASADEAFGLLTDFRPRVLVSDIGMPGKDGFEFIREVRGLDCPEMRAIPALALTAFARSEDRNRAMLAGFHLHIAKPIEPRELGVAVASLALRAPN